MNAFAKLGTAALVASVLAPAALADGRNPGSVLIYPIHRSGLFNGSEVPSNFFTVVSVTNSNVSPVSGATNVQFDYVNTIENPLDSQLPLDCFVVDRVENLTPADTLSVLTSCHNAAGGQEGYLVVTAQNPSLFKTAWSFNYLMGSELVVTSLGGVYSINAIPFEAKAAQGDPTDTDGDGQLDFDDVEYEGVPETLYIDSFIALGKSSLTLLNLTGGTQFTALVKFDIFNDNEFPLSATKTFRCWFEEKLEDVSLVFQESFLANNTPNDPIELDTNCNNDDNLETGWAIINGIVANSNVESIPNPALLGAITAGPANGIDGGRLLWESAAKQFNGDFLKFGTNDPEHP